MAVKDKIVGEQQKYKITLKYKTGTTIRLFVEGMQELSLTIVSILSDARLMDEEMLEEMHVDRNKPTT